MSRRTIDQAERRFRLSRLPPLMQPLVTNREMAMGYLGTASLVRPMIAAGYSPAPGVSMSLAEYDAILDLIKDAIGLSQLSDEESETALRLSTTSEYREARQ